MNSKITALIVTYQRPRVLRRAILSVIGQTYKNIKISIFDGDISNIDIIKSVVILKNSFLKLVRKLEVRSELI